MSGLPQRVLDLFDQVVTKPRSSSASSSSSSDSGAAADTATSHTLPSSTRIVAFDNTAFPPPTKCTTMSDVPGFPSAVCVPATSVDSAPIPPRPQNATHLAEFVIAFLTSRSGDAGVFDDIAAGIIATLGIVPRGGAEEENVRHRLAMFLGWMKKGQRAVVVAQNSSSGSATGGGERLACGPSSGNGISSDLRWVGWPDDLKRQKKEVVWKVLTAPGDERKFEMRTFFAGESGWTVVSDVDDTIKVSEVNNRIALLRNTFVAEPSPTNGMPPFYQAINAKLHPNWFYLSASPWQLYPFLHDFISSPSPFSAGQTLYPRGQLILRDMNRGAMPIYLSSLTMGTREYKFDRLEKIHTWLPEPNRRVLLIGDSTQTDPESYGDVARKWPTWVGAIWIRVVKGVDESKEKDLNDPKRFEKAFEGVDKSIWRTFEDPNTLADALAGLKV